MKKALIFQILSYAIPIIVILYIVNVVLKKVGLIDTKESKEKDAAKERIINSDVFNPNYSESVYGYKRLSSNEAEKFAQDLESSFPWYWGTDEPLIYSTFKKLYNKVNVSEVAYKYQGLFNKDLRADIVDALDKSELLILDSIIEDLPNR